MRKFNVKFIREFHMQIEADSSAMARQLTQGFLEQLPQDSWRLLSIIAEDYVEQPCEGCAVDELNPNGRPPAGNPEGGGTPGGTVVKLPTLVDQVAAA